MVTSFAMRESHFDDHQRSFLLPSGCGDLLDVIKRDEALKALKAAAERRGAKSLPVPMGTIEIGAEITIKELAGKLGWKPFMVIAVLISWKVFPANDGHVLPFDLAARIAEVHGFKVNRVD